MSGFVSAGLTLATVVFSVLGDVTIGAFTAFGIENPESMPWGGRQQIAEHKLIGGARILDIMGPDENDIKWSGLFQGPLAQERALLLDSLRVRGAVVPLTWPGDGRWVVIQDFTASYERNGYLIPYSISCKVVPGNAPAGFPNLATVLAGDVGMAVSAIGSLV